MHVHKIRRDATGVLITHAICEPQSNEIAFMLFENYYSYFIENIPSINITYFVSKFIKYIW